MELKTLLIGVIFTMAIFAVKNGVGLHYLMSQRRWIKTKLSFFSLFFFVYFFLFMLCSHILIQFDIVVYLEIVQDFLKTGMLIHALMAAGLIIWGIFLLKGGDRSDKGSYGWVAMIIPCPVCATVVFISLSFLLSYFPESGHLATLWAYLAFMSMVLITVIGMSLWGIRSNTTPESTMGAAMLLIAVYFLLSIIILPQFGDIGKIYRLAGYRGEKQIIDTKQLLMLSAIMAAFFSGGFFIMMSKIKRGTKWI